MRILTATVGPLAAASANSIAASQNGTANTKLTLTASPVVLDKPRRVGITSAGNDSGIFFTIVGTDWNGNNATEQLTGANAGTAQSFYDYATVISIAPSAATALAVTAGTTAVASTRPLFLDEYANGQVAIEVDVSGTVNATVQQSLNDPNAYGSNLAPNPLGYTSVNWVNAPDTALQGLTATVQSNYAFAPKIVRLTLNSGSGSAKISLQQAGVVPL